MTKLIRSNTIELDKAPRAIPDSDVAKVIRILNRDDDHGLVLDEIVNRYARSIVKIRDENTGTETEQVVKVQRAVETAIREGFYEVMHLRWLPRVCHETATLWTEPGMGYEYTIGDQPHEATKKLLEQVREDGKDEIVMPQVDALAVATGTAGEYIAVESGRLRYQPAGLNAIFVAFGDVVFEDTEDRPRPPNKGRLEEATVVVLRMGTQPNGKGLYYAWFGRCNGKMGDWQNGRHVRFEADSWRDIPKPGDGGLDYTVSGEFKKKPAPDELANPLTLWANGNGDEAGPEYPIALFYEDALAQGTQLLRCTGISRFKTNMEFDIGASRIFTATLKAARGIQALKNPKGQPLPKGWDEGMVQLYRDQLLEIYNVPGINSQYAHGIVAKNMRLAAEAEGVAGYLVDADQAHEASGVSLQVQNYPMIRRRRQRVRANRPSQRRKFNIERALLNSMNGKAAGVIPLDVRETWNPGERQFPEDPTSAADNAIKWYDKKAFDKIELVRRAYGLPTRKDAKAKIIEQDKDAQENPELFGEKAAPAAPPPPASMAERLKARRAQQQPPGQPVPVPEPGKEKKAS